MSLLLERQFAQDRAMRDAAFELVKADFSHLRTDLSAQGLASRFTARLGEGATDLYEDAVEAADNHRGLLAGLLAAIILWFAREPIIDLLTGEDRYEDYEDDEEPGAQPHDYDGE